MLHVGENVDGFIERIQIDGKRYHGKIHLCMIYPWQRVFIVAATDPPWIIGKTYTLKYANLTLMRMEEQDAIYTERRDDLHTFQSTGDPRAANTPHAQNT